MLRLPPEGPGPCHFDERADELGPGWHGFEERERFGSDLEGPRVSQGRHDLDQREHPPGSGGEIAQLPERCDRLLQRLRRLSQSAGVERGLTESREDLRALRMPSRSEGEGTFEAGHGCGRIKPERPLPREREEPKGGGFQVGDQFTLAGGSRELRGRRVVIREDLREIFDARRRLGLDPARRRDVTRGPRCPW